jgi:hypothetical protein
VGEIAANWQETLREAVLIRYHQEDDPDENHPLDQLHDAIVGNNIIAEIKEENANIGTKSNLKLKPDIAAILHDRFTSTESPSTTLSSAACGEIVMVHHEMDLTVARRSIEKALQFSMPSSSLPMIRVCESLPTFQLVAISCKMSYC